MSKKQTNTCFECGKKVDPDDDYCEDCEDESTMSGESSSEEEKLDIDDMTVSLGSVPKVAKTAVFNLVEGMKIEEIMKENRDGVTVYSFEGTKKGSGYTIEVDSKGQILNFDEEEIDEGDDDVSMASDSSDEPEYLDSDEEMKIAEEQQKGLSFFHRPKRKSIFDIIKSKQTSLGTPSGTLPKTQSKITVPKKVVRAKITNPLKNTKILLGGATHKKLMQQNIVDEAGNDIRGNAKTKTVAAKTTPKPVVAKTTPKPATKTTTKPVAAKTTTKPVAAKTKSAKTILPPKTTLPVETILPPKTILAPKTAKNFDKNC